MLKDFKTNEKKGGVGVVVGRFQAPVLHEVHKSLLEEVYKRHEKVMVFLGVSAVMSSRRNPLDFESRKRMLQEACPEAIIIPIKDTRSDAEWSRELDKRIKEVYPLEGVMLYGGRDSFIKNYSGQFEACEFERCGTFSATKEREKAARQIRNSEDWRAGVIYGVYNQYEKAVMCVDIALMKEDRKKIVLGKRNSEDKHRFLGGHVHPNDENLEYSARKELAEEAGRNVEISCLKYAGSFQVDDWRYKNNCDKIMTALFVADYQFGNLEAGDDIDKLEVFNVEDFLEENLIAKNLVEEHIPLMKNLIDFLRKEVCPCKNMKS